MGDACPNTHTCTCEPWVPWGPPLPDIWLWLKDHLSAFIWMLDCFSSPLYVSLVPKTFDVSCKDFKVIFQVYIQDFCKSDMIFFFGSAQFYSHFLWKQNKSNQITMISICVCVFYSFFI